MILKNFLEFVNSIQESTFDINFEISNVEEDLKDAKQRLKQLDSDMNHEAGQKGEDWSDEDANRYGGEMNNLETEIERLQKKLSDLNKEYETEEEREADDQVVSNFLEIVEDVSNPSEIERETNEDGCTELEITIDNVEFEFVIKPNDVYLKHFDDEVKIGDIFNELPKVKKFLTKIIPLSDEEFNNYFNYLLKNSGIDSEIESY